MSVERLTKGQLADRLGESTKQITRYVAEGCPTSQSGREQTIPWATFRRWWLQRKIRLERERLEREKPIDFEKARGRKMEAEAREAELRVERMLGEVVPLAVVEQIAAKICGRMLPVLQNAPSNYGLHLEKLGVKPEDAERVLEAIATDLTRALQSTADEHEIEASVGEEEETKEADGGRATA